MDLNEVRIAGGLEKYVLRPMVIGATIVGLIGLAAGLPGCGDNSTLTTTTTPIIPYSKTEPNAATYSIFGLR